MRKRLTGAILMAAMAMCLVACGGGSTEATTTTETTETEEVESDDSDDEESTEKYSEITWPSAGSSSVLPVPKSNVGKILWDDENNFSVTIAETSKTDFDEYVNSCRDKGFTVNYSSNDGWYTAETEDGWYLSVQYSDKKETMTIDMYRTSYSSDSSEDTTESTDSSEDTTTESTESSEDTTESSADGIDPDFKEAVDSYEEFFDEYCEFMEKYNSSSDPVSMAADYASFTAQYAETMSKLNGLDDGTLTNEELTYYTEAMSRITAKLVAVSQ